MWKSKELNLSFWFLDRMKAECMVQYHRRHITIKRRVRFGIITEDEEGGGGSLGICLGTPRLGSTSSSPSAIGLTGENSTLSSSSCSSSLSSFIIFTAGFSVVRSFFCSFSICTASSCSFCSCSFSCSRSSSSHCQGTHWSLVRVRIIPPVLGSWIEDGQVSK